MSQYLSALEASKSRLCFNEQFFAYFTSRMVTIPTKDTETSKALVPTAGVTIKNGRVYMYYNVDWFEKLTALERDAVLKHEVLHIVYQHIDMHNAFQGLISGDLASSGMNDSTQKKLINVAEDLAINSHLKNLPKGGCKPGEGEFAKFPSGLSTFEYLSLLKNECKNNPNGKISEFVKVYEFDVHDMLKEVEADGKLSSAEKAFMKAEIQRAFQAGNTSLQGDLRDLIYNNFCRPLNWKALLDSFVNSTVRSDMIKSVKRLNRYMPFQHAGSSIERRPFLAISIDESGSVSDEMLTKFFAHLSKLAQIADFTVIPFDYDVGTPYVWKKGTHKKAQRELQGGTNFDAPTDYVNSKPKFDGHIILTDLGASFPKRSRIKRIWITDDSCKSPSFEAEASKFGERIIYV